jgi:hypothetical protein
MTYEIELETPSGVYLFDVEGAHFDDSGVRFTGFPPQDCAKEIRDMFRFMSKENTAILKNRDRIEHLEVGFVVQY